jgi:hypothetical protein
VLCSLNETFFEHPQPGFSRWTKKIDGSFFFLFYWFFIFSFLRARCTINKGP